MTWAYNNYFVIIIQLKVHYNYLNVGNETLFFLKEISWKDLNEGNAIRSRKYFLKKFIIQNTTSNSTSLLISNGIIAGTATHFGYLTGRLRGRKQSAFPSDSSATSSIFVARLKRAHGWVSGGSNYIEGGIKVYHVRYILKHWTDGRWQICL